jgi:hypothetical protein
MSADELLAPLLSCWGSSCSPTAAQVCHPIKTPAQSQEEWEATLAKWAAQQASPFVQYRLMKKPEVEGEPLVDLTPEELNGARVNRGLA